MENDKKVFSFRPEEVTEEYLEYFLMEKEAELEFLRTAVKEELQRRKEGRPIEYLN